MKLLGLPTAPLRAAIGQLDHDGLDRLVELTGYRGDWRASYIRKAIARPTISVYIADRIAVALGHHPSAFWGADYFALAPDDEPAEVDA